MSMPVFAVTGRGNEAKRARDLVAVIGGTITTKDHEANYLVVVKGAGRRKVEDYCRMHSKRNGNGNSAGDSRLLLLDMLEDWSRHGRVPQREVSLAEIQSLNIIGGNSDDVAGRRSYAVPGTFLKRSRVTVDAEGLLVDESDNAVILPARHAAKAEREKNKKGEKEGGSVGIAHRPLLLDSETPPKQRVRQSHVDPVHSSGTNPNAAKGVEMNPMREAFRRKPKPDWDTFFADPAPVGGSGRDSLGSALPSKPAALSSSNGDAANRMHSNLSTSAAMVTKSKRNGLEMTFDFSKSNGPSQPHSSLRRPKNGVLSPAHQSGVTGNKANGRDKTDTPSWGSSGSNSSTSSSIGIKSMRKKSEGTRRRSELRLSTTPVSTSTTKLTTTTTKPKTTTETTPSASTFAVPQKVSSLKGRDRPSRYQPTATHRLSTVHPNKSTTENTTIRSSGGSAPATRTTTTIAATTKKQGTGRMTAPIGQPSHAFSSRHGIPTANVRAGSKITTSTNSGGPSRRTAQSSEDSHSSLLKRVRQSEYCKGVPEETCVSILQQVVDRACPVSFGGIAGLEVCKRILQEAIILPAKCPQLFTGLRRPCSGLLLFGPPGNGKTLLAKAVARECDTTFFSVSAAAITSKWVGESEKMVRALFAVARALAPSTIFVDEIDALLQVRGSQNEGEGSRRIKTEFLVQMDGAGNDTHEARVLVMGATNRPFDLDEAIIRRFSKRVFVPLPDKPARAQILHSLLNTDETPNSFTPAEWDRIAEMTENYSGHDLRQLCEELAMLPVRALFEDKLRKGEDLAAEVHQDALRPLTLHDVEGCVQARKPSCCLQQLRALDDWNNNYGSR